VYRHIMTHTTTPKDTAPPRLTCTVEEAAEMLGISRHSAYRAARNGELGAIRIGHRLLVPLARLDELLGRRQDS
jgi:excisionase family DNA binding protein